jgi:RNA polymerase sigma factor (sigma-70 family)
MDRELVARAMTGDHVAFTAIATASIGRLSAIARLILHDSHWAEDAVQEALVAAWRDIRGLRDPDRFEPWLRRVLVRACYDMAGQNKHQRIVEVALLANADHTPPDDGLGLPIHDQVDRAMRQLSTDQRAVLVLTYYLDLPLAEGARTLGIPLGTMKSRVKRSLSALRARLDADAREPARIRERLA